MTDSLPAEKAAATGSPSMEDTAESRLKRTLFIVEATSFQQFMLWKDWCAQSDSPRHGKQTWEQINPGWLVKVGELAGFPCNIAVTWNRIEGQLVMFWYQCSRVTDSELAEKWLHENFEGTWDGGTRRAQCDAQNFHHCAHAIKEANNQAEG